MATQGRAFWILDDLTPLRNWTTDVERSAVYLFPPRPAPRIQTEKVDEDDPPKGAGTNLPNGVFIDYWLKEKPKKDQIVKIEVLSEGKVIRSFSSEKKDAEGDLKERNEKKQQDKEMEKDKPLEPKQGVNRFLWDMRVFKPVLAPKAVFDEGEKAPPRVGPGTYEIRLTVAGQTLSAKAEVTPRPHGPATEADLKAQFTLLEAVRDRLSENHETVLAVRDVRAQVKDLGERAERMGKGGELAKRAAALAEKLSSIELELTNPDIKADEDDLNYEPKLDHDWVALASVVASADRRPTAGSARYYEVLRAKQDAVMGRWRALLAADLADFSRTAEEMKLPRVAPAPKIERP